MQSSSLPVPLWPKRCQQCLSCSILPQHHAHHHGFLSALQAQTLAASLVSAGPHGSDSPFHTLVVKFAANWNCYQCVGKDRCTRQMHGVTDRVWHDVPGLHHTAPAAQAEICHIPRGAQWSALASNSPENGSRNTHRR